MVALSVEAPALTGAPAAVVLPVTVSERLLVEPTLALLSRAVLAYSLVAGVRAVLGSAAAPA